MSLFLSSAPESSTVPDGAVKEPPGARLRRLLEEAASTPRDEASVSRRIELGAEVLALLTEWRAGGGEVRLEAPRVVEHVRAPAPPKPPPSGDIQALLLSILDGMVFSSDDEVEVLRLHAAIRDSDRWCGLPREIQRGVVALTVARLRRLQDDRRLIHPRLEECFSMLTAFSKREQPGYVVGLSRHHTPVRGGWQEDAEAWWERMRATATGQTAPSLPPTIERLVGGVVAAVASLQAATDPAERAAAEDEVRKRVAEALAAGLSHRDPRLLKAVGGLASVLTGPELKVLRREVLAQVD